MKLWLIGTDSEDVQYIHYAHMVALVRAPDAETAVRLAKDRCKDDLQDWRLSDLEAVEVVGEGEPSVIKAIIATD